MAIYYPGLRSRDFADNRAFVCERLMSLREALRGVFPTKTLDKNLIVGSWNLRDFGRAPGSGFNPDPRLPETFYYIAQIIDRFDVVALQEVNENLADFQRLMKILGSHYDYIATDATEGVSGNSERMAFVYDTRKVSFRNIAGEIVLPQGKEDVTQFARTPFVVSFQCGWLKFDLCTAHLYYGSDSGEKKERRVEEIRKLGKFMMKRALDQGTNTFILGDFNVVGPDDDTWKALDESGFKTPDAVRDLRTNLDGEKYYDRIAFASAKDEVSFDDSLPGGSFKYFDHVFRDTDETRYAAGTTEIGPTMPYRKWSTWQISDHYPLWVQLETDFSERYLRKLGAAPSSGG